MSDWTGNTQSVMATLNASNHSEGERAENDYYATNPKALKLLLELEEFRNVWEPACGGGHLAEVLRSVGILSRSTDLVDRGYGEANTDFLNYEGDWAGDIITNPPFKYATEFVEKSLNIVKPGCKIAMFLRIQFLEGVKRRKMFDKTPPKVIYVSSRTIRCAKNGDFDNATGNASTYAWFIWEKGYTGETVLRWFN